MRTREKHGSCFGLFVGCLLFFFVVGVCVGAAHQHRSRHRMGVWPGIDWLSMAAGPYPRERDNKFRRIGIPLWHHRQFFATNPNSRVLSVDYDVQF